MNEFEKPEFISQLEEYIDAIIQNGDEPEMMSRLHQVIKEYDVHNADPLNPYVSFKDLDFDIDDAIGELTRSRIIAEMLLLRSWNTFKSAKYNTIFSITTQLAKCYQTKNDFASVVSESEHVRLYFEDALDTSPDDFNIIGGICDILYYELRAKNELDEPFDETIEMLNEYIPFMIVAADKDKYKLNAALIIGQIADIFVHKMRYEEACQFYPKAFQIVSQIENLDTNNKYIYAIFAGHYNVALLGCKQKDWDAIKRSILIEETLYKQLNETFGDIRSKMNLAIAYSHKGSYYEQNEDYKNASDCHFLKIQLITETFQIEDNEGEYTEEARLDSLIKSMQPIINYGLLSNPSERIDTFKKAYSMLFDILNYIFDIRILGYANAFAMEIFKASDGINDEEAETFLFKKISVLVHLIVDYGTEEGIVSDLKQTINESKSFVERIGEKLQDHNKQVWKTINSAFPT